MRAALLVLAFGFGALVAGGAASSQPETFRIPDERDDVRVGSDGPPSPYARPEADLRGLRIEDEDGLGFSLIVELGEVETKEFDVRPLYAPAELELAVAFRVGPHRLWLSGQFEAWPSAQGVLALDVRWPPWLCRLDTKDACIGVRHEVAMELDPKRNELRLPVPKSVLVEGPHEASPKGTPVHAIHVTTRLTNAVFLATHLLVDTLDGGDRSYAFQVERANADVRLWPEAGGRLVLAPGQNATFVVAVNNSASERRLVQLDYPRGLPHGLTMGGPAVVSVPARANRTVLVWAQAADGLGFLPPAAAALRARSVGVEGHHAHAPLELAVQPAMGPNGRLYVHALPSEAPVEDPSGYAVRPPPLFVSALEKDLRASTVFEYPLRAHTPGLATFLVQPQSIDRLPGPLRLNATRPIVVEAALRTDLGAYGFNTYVVLETRSSHGDWAKLAERTREVEVTPAGTTVRFEAPLPKDVKVLARGTEVRLTLSITAGANAGLVAGSTQTRLILGGATFLELPVEPNLEPAGMPAASPFQLTSVDDVDQFVNAGERRAVRLWLLNQESVPQRVDLVVNQTRHEWLVEVRPGRTFDLEPGASITVAIYVVPPASSPEGERETLSVGARPQAGVAATLTLRFTTASAVDLPEDAVDAFDDRDARERLVKETPAKSPAPHVLWLYAAWALVRRR